MAVAKDAVAFCGDTHLDWEDILRVIVLAVARGWFPILTIDQYLENSSREPVFGGGAVSAMRQNYRASMPSPTSKDDSIGSVLVHLFQLKDSNTFTCAKFAWTIHLSRPRRASDQRDKIFAPQGLTHRYKMPSDWSLLQPDYTQSVTEVFTRATCYILQKLENLVFLSFVEDKSIRSYQDLPSWVPDFSKPLNPLPLSMFRAYNASCGFKGTKSQCIQSIMG